MDPDKGWTLNCPLFLLVKVKQNTEVYFMLWVKERLNTEDYFVFVGQGKTNTEVYYVFVGQWRTEHWIWLCVSGSKKDLTLDCPLCLLLEEKLNTEVYYVFVGQRKTEQWSYFVSVDQGKTEWTLKFTMCSWIQLNTEHLAVGEIIEHRTVIIWAGYH